MKRINEVSQIFGVSRRTLQYYDDIGLLTAVRSPENYRLYGQEELERLWQILQYRKAGFMLEEIRKLLESSDDAKAQILDERIRELQKARFRLEEQIRMIEGMQRSGLPPVPEVFHEETPERICK